MVGLLLAITGPAVAQPPNPDLCADLTGDALTRCLYSALDDRVRALEPTPSPTPTPTPTPSETATPTPTQTPTPASGSWLSGASNDSSLTVAQFGSWRGSPTEIVGTWINDPAIYPFGPKISGCGGCGQYADWTGAADVGITPANWQGWAAEAAGANDTFWRNTARKLKEYRAGKGTTYVRPWYEYNGNWMNYSAKSGDLANFKAAFARVDSIFNQEFPEAKMMLGSAAADKGYSVESSWPAGVDVLSIDFYNEWGWCNTQVCFDDKIENGGGANSLADLQRLAKAKGVPIIISEWANANHTRAASSGGGGDAPQFMASMYAWIKANAGTGAGQVMGEVYFNIPSGYDASFWLVKSGLVTNPEGPQSAAKYRELWKTN